MTNIFLILFFLLGSPPLGLDWNKTLEDIPKIEQYKYWFGDLNWGRAVYLGEDFFLDMQAEITVSFVSGKIDSAILILGPGGLHEANCMAKYKEVNEYLTRKYGSRKILKSTEDPIIDDMIYYRECYAIKAGLKQYETSWHWKDFQVTSVVFADDGDIYIEIEYIKVPLRKKKNKQEIKNIIKKL